MKPIILHKNSVNIFRSRDNYVNRYIEHITPVEGSTAMQLPFLVIFAHPWKFVAHFWVILVTKHLQINVFSCLYFANLHIFTHLTIFTLAPMAKSTFKPFHPIFTHEPKYFTQSWIVRIVLNSISDPK
jgi:hypothetical protein